MKLWKCPAIVGHITDRTTRAIMDQAAAKIRRQFDATPTDGGELRKIAEDIWAIDKPLGLHKDKTKAGYWVFGVVLINDMNLLLSVESVLYDLPVGTIYALDGRRLHAALAHNSIRPGLISFLAWDVEKRTDVQELIDAFPDSLDAWVNDIPRVDIA